MNPGVVSEEEVAARILADTVHYRTTLRKAAEEFFTKHPGLDYMRPIVRALGTGVARHFLLLDHGLSKLGYGPPSQSQKWMLARILAYEALMGKLKKSRAQRAAQKAGIRLADLEALREMGISGVVSGLSGQKRLSILYSMPQWILEEILRLEPPSPEKLLKTLNTDPARWIRISPWVDRAWLVRRLRANGVVVEPDPLLPGIARIISGAEKASRLEEHAKGFYVFQDKASSLVVYTGEPRGKTVVDVTAGPGSKITLAGWLGARHLVAGDLKPHRAVEVSKLAARTGVDHLIDVYQGDARQPPLRLKAADLVIVDPPCTDLGRLQYEPEIKMWLTRGDMAFYSRLQRTMLSRILAEAKPGARIVYSVCTITWRETVWVTRRVLEETPYASPVEPPIRIGVRVKGVPEAQLLLPHLHGTQGFSILLLEKK